MTLSALSTSPSAFSTGSAATAAQQPPAAKTMAKLGYEEQPATDGFTASAAGNTSAAAAQGLKSASQAQFGLPCLIPCLVLPCLAFCAVPILAIGAAVAWGVSKLVGAVSGGVKAATSEQAPPPASTASTANDSGVRGNIRPAIDE